ncbi:MAG: polyphosphate kinase 2 [Pararhodobacter sp.]|nr:polyphosphate kinase 2 [Pararhodobacter sp.]
MPNPETDLPFDGAISRFLAEEATDAMRTAIAEGRKRDIISDKHPYDRWMPKAAYEAHLAALQIELVKFKAWVERTGQRVVLIFEGRDTAGKSGAIARVAANLNPRSARIMALSAPSDRERRQWYFQRYVEHLPPQGEMVLMDRSWYNRAVIEHVFGFCTNAQREAFFAQLPAFEQTLVQEGVHLIKLWFNVSRAEQLRRMLARESHPLKQWKLSRIDVEGLGKWDAYTAAIAETFQRSDFPFAPWTVILGDDKYRARLAAIQRILGAFDYDGKDAGAIGTPDAQVMGGPAIWPRA